MNDDQDHTNELDLPFELKEALVKLCFEFGNEKDVLNVVIKSILQGMKEQGFHVRHPLEVVGYEGGCEFIVGWGEAIGEERLAHVLAVLANTGESLPKGAVLTDITKVELTRFIRSEKA